MILISRTKAFVAADVICVSERVVATALIIACSFEMEPSPNVKTTIPAYLGNYIKK